MHINLCRLLFTFICVIMFCNEKSYAADQRTLSLVSSTGLKTITISEVDPVNIEVKINDATDIAGASFTLTYDTTNLLLTGIDSNFFGTFAQQITPDPGCVTLGQTYCSPIVENVVSGLATTTSTGSMIAAARAQKGSGTNISLFTLHFELKSGGSPGTYPIGLVQSKISNASAGYAPNTPIPVLVGIDNSGGYPSYDVPSVEQFSLIIESVFTDNDSDDIDDNWEMDNLPNSYSGDPLDVFDKFEDHDNDGYTDYQEYINFTANLTDPNSGAFDPTIRNSAWGIGYEPYVEFLPAVYQILLLKE